MPTTSQLNYRADIDGLRAVAIIAVLGFHFFPEYFSSGFIGVDIFFVISGFLITTIISRDLAANEFSVLKFYKRRVNRVFPALIFVLIFCGIAGWFVLLQDEYKSLGKYIAGASAFISNFITWNEIGYFDTAAELKPLLHLWSLGIEEQFYLLWPLILLFSKKHFRPIIVCIALFGFSFFYNVCIYKSDPNADFFSPLARMWEPVCGGLLACLISTKHFTIFNKSLTAANLMAALGFANLSVAFFLARNGVGYPGWIAVFPCLGAMFLLVAGKSAGLSRSILSYRLLVGIGLISYPLYLWHWPLLSFAKYLAGPHLSLPARLLLLGLSFLLAWLTYKFVEIPIRRGKLRQRAPVFLAAIMLFLCAGGYLVFLTGGISGRAVAKQNQPTDVEIFFNSSCVNDPRIDAALDFCAKNIVADPQRPTVVIWGDSQGMAWSPVFLKLAKEFDFNLILFSHPSCAPMLGVRTLIAPTNTTANELCRDVKLGQLILSSIEKIHPKMVFLIAAWNTYVYRDFITESPDDPPDFNSSLLAFNRKLPETIARLDEISPLVVFKTLPILRESPIYQINRIGFFIAKHQKDLKRFSQHKTESKIENDIMDSIKGTKQTRFLDPAELVCTEFCDYVIGGNLIYRDPVHISHKGSFLIEDQLREILKGL